MRILWHRIKFEFVVYIIDVSFSTLDETHFMRWWWLYGTLTEYIPSPSIGFWHSPYLTKNSGKLYGWGEKQTTPERDWITVPRASSPFQARLSAFYRGDWKRIETEVHLFDTTVRMQLYILTTERGSRIPWLPGSVNYSFHQTHVWQMSPLGEKKKNLSLNFDTKKCFDHESFFHESILVAAIALELPF